MSANSTAGCCTGQTNSLYTESRKRDKTAGQKPSKSTRKSLLTGFFIVPLLLLGVLLGASPAAAVDALPNATCPSNLSSCASGDIKTTVVGAEEIGGDDCADGSLDVQWTFEFETWAN